MVWARFQEAEMGWMLKWQIFMQNVTLLAWQCPNCGLNQWIGWSILCLKKWKKWFLLGLGKLFSSKSEAEGLSSTFGTCSLARASGPGLAWTCKFQFTPIWPPVKLNVKICQSHWNPHSSLLGKAIFGFWISESNWMKKIPQKKSNKHLRCHLEWWVPERHMIPCRPLPKRRKKKLPRWWSLSTLSIW